MRCLLVLVTVLGLPRVATAAPAADLVVVWAPARDIGPVARVARDAGAALVDRSPAPPSVAGTGTLIARGIEGYDKVRYDDAWQALEKAREAVDKTGAEGLTAAQLSDLFLYRGLIRTQRADPTAFDELAMAIVIDPTRTFDAARFAPDVIENLERARTAVSGRPRATLTIDAPANCTITVDGSATDSAAPRLSGTHWVRVSCPDHAPWATRVDVIAPTTHVVARPVRFAAPTDSELLIQARTAGATGLVFAEVRGDVATARLIGLDGRERDRRTVSIRRGLEPLAGAVRELLTPPPQVKWYRTKWAYAGAAALIAAAIAIPITAAITRDTGPASAMVRIPETLK